MFCFSFIVFFYVSSFLIQSFFKRLKVKLYDINMLRIYDFFVRSWMKFRIAGLVRPVV